MRKSFLDSHDGDVVFIEVLEFTSHWTAERVQELAEAAGKTLSDSEARSLALDLRTRSVREDLAERGAEMERPLEELPSFVPPEIDRKRAEREADRNKWWEDILTFKGFHIRNGTDAWRVYFYRFVDPDSRGGSSANFAERIRTARAVVLPEGSCVVFHSQIGR